MICLRIQLRRTFITGHLGRRGATLMELQVAKKNMFDFSVSDKHLVPHDFMDVALKPVKQRLKAHRCSLKHSSNSGFFAFSSTIQCFCFTIRTCSPLSFDDLSFNVNDLLLATKTSENGHHSAIISHRASPEGQQ